MEIVYLEYAVGIILIIYGFTFLRLSRMLGEYGNYQINSITGVISFIFNPLNWYRLYYAFYTIAKEDTPPEESYIKTYYVNLFTFVIFFILVALIIRNQ